jgi:hypothetical protein
MNTRHPMALPVHAQMTPTRPAPAASSSVGGGPLSSVSESVREPFDGTVPASLEA